MSGRHRRETPDLENASDDGSERAGSDAADSHVAASRADGDGGGAHVGQQNSDDDFDAGETGAEARAQHD